MLLNGAAMNVQVRIYGFVQFGYSNSHQKVSYEIFKNFFKKFSRKESRVRKGN
jgi:hypothetical protein